MWVKIVCPVALNWWHVQDVTTPSPKYNLDGLWHRIDPGELLRRREDGSEFSLSRLEKFTIESFSVKVENLNILWEWGGYGHTSLLPWLLIGCILLHKKLELMKVHEGSSINSIKINSILLVTLIKPTVVGLRGKKTGNWKSTKTHNMYL